MSEKLRDLADQVVKQTDLVAQLQKNVDEESTGLIAEEEVPESATAELTGKRKELWLAQSELERIRNEYNAELARYRASQQ